MMLKKETDSIEIIKKLRESAKDLREHTSLHTVAALMDDAADKLTEYVRNDIERG